mgnify:CR=1 FL=1
MMNLEQKKEYDRKRNLENKDERRKNYLNNKDKIIEQSKKYYSQNKEMRRGYRLKELYNITIDQYNKMFTDQKGCCKICERHQSKLSKRLGVDHNHTTGKVRGLLCDSCNTNIGKYNEDTKILNKMIEYIKEHNNE